MTKSYFLVTQYGFGDNFLLLVINFSSACFEHHLRNVFLWFPVIFTRFHGYAGVAAAPKRTFGHHGFGHQQLVFLVTKIVRLLVTKILVTKISFAQRFLMVPGDFYKISWLRRCRSVVVGACAAGQAAAAAEQAGF